MQKQTCSHDARGWNRQQVLGAVRWVDWGYDSSLSACICLCPRCGDGENSCLVVGCGGRRKGNTLVLLLFHLVQEHGILYLVLKTVGLIYNKCSSKIGYFFQIEADVFGGFFGHTCPGTVGIGDQKYDELK